MELAWLVVVILVLIIVAVVWLWLGARSGSEKGRAELDRASRRASEAEQKLDTAERERRNAQDEAGKLAARLKELEAARDAGGFDNERIYKLQAKGNLESPDGPRAYGVAQEDSGAVRPFLIEESLGHLEVGDCFGVLRGKLAKVSEDDFEAGGDAPAASGEPAAGGKAAATQLRGAVPAGDEAGTSAPTELRPAQNAPQETKLFVAAKQEPPDDPNKGLPYLSVGDDGEEQIHHLAFDRVSAGRGSDNDIVLEDDSASRLHFTVSFTGNRFVLEDNNSTNGTRCNGERVTRKELEFGDEIEVGGTTIRFSCEGFDLKDEDAGQAVAALEACVARQPDFINALKLLAFMLERNVARRKEAVQHWERVARLEASS